MNEDSAKGQDTVGIDIRMKSPGYITIAPDRKTGIVQGVSVFLTHAFHEWVLKNPK